MDEEKIKRVPKGMSFKNIGHTGIETNPAYNQEDFLNKFKGQQYYKTIEEMISNEPVIGASSFCIKKLIKQAPVVVEPSSDSPKDIEAAKFCEEARLDMSQPWNHFLEECLSHVDYGFSVHEINYKVRRGQKRNRPSERSQYNDNRIGWRGLPIRAQKSISKWTYDTTDNQDLSGVEQMVAGRLKVWIPIDKLLLFRTGVYKDNPQGQSIYRRAYVPYFYKKELQRIQSIGYERSFNGLPVIYAPVDIMTDEADDSQKALFAELKKIVSNIRMDEQSGLVMPAEYDESGNKLYEFNLVSSAGKVDDGMETSIRRYTLEMLLTTMTDLLLLGHGENGSFALASSKTSMFAIAASNYMREIEEVFNRHAIPRLLELNQIEYDNLPKLKFGDIEITDMEVISASVKNLFDAGMDLSDVENELRVRMGLPKKTTSQPMLKPQSNTPTKETPDVPETD